MYEEDGIVSVDNIFTKCVSCNKTKDGLCSKEKKLKHFQVVCSVKQDCFTS